jgi:protein-tyrosine phosphatase
LELVSQARLVLTATRAVRSDVVQLYPPAVQRSFTIRQAGRILADAAESFMPISTDAADLVDELRLFITRHRGPQPGDPALEDVVDPRGRPAAVHELAAQQMRPALGLLALALGVEPTWPDWVRDNAHRKHR